MQINLNKQLTQNFKLGEFLTSKFYDKDQQKKVLKSVTHPILANIHELADNLQVLRDEINNPIHINIAYRPLWWELQNGRSGNSQHVKGKAADIRVDGMSPRILFDIIERLQDKGKMTKGGMKAYTTFLHYDIRGFNARW